ncbi:MAG: 5'-3' exonuclease H3TH domain-containing protein [Acidobacteriota bacterium]
MAQIHLVDASPYVFRAYFSLPDAMRDPAGRPMHAAYGFATFLLKLVEDERATHLALGFDESLTSSFRNDLLPTYKSSRELPPEDLERQFTLCQRLADALSIPRFSSARFEAEDHLASLAASLLADDPEHRLVVVSSDKDLLQLVSARVELFDAARDARFDPPGVLAKVGVRPEQIPDYLGLAGDSVDDIPGVRGVGKKTAVALLSAFDSLEDALGNLDDVEQLQIRGARALRRKLEAEQEVALLSKRLAILATDAPADATLDELTVGPPNEQLLDPLIEELGWQALGERLRRFGRGGDPSQIAGMRST